LQYEHSRSVLGVNELQSVDGFAVYGLFEAHEQWNSAVFAEVACVLLL